MEKWIAQLISWLLKKLHVIQFRVFNTVSYTMEFVEEFSQDEKTKIGNEFSRLKGFVYLDSAGSMLYGEDQIRQVSEVLTTNLFCNPHTSKTTDNIVDAVRYR